MTSEAKSVWNGGYLSDAEQLEHGLIDKNDEKNIYGVFTEAGKNKFFGFFDMQIDDAVSLLKQMGPDAVTFLERHRAFKDDSDELKDPPEKDACANGGGVVWAFKQIFGFVGIHSNNIWDNGLYGEIWRILSQKIKVSNKKLIKEAITRVSHAILDVYMERDYVEDDDVQGVEKYNSETLTKHIAEKLYSTLYLKSLITLLISKVKKRTGKLIKRTRKRRKDRKRQRQEKWQEDQRRLKHKTEEELTGGAGSSGKSKDLKEFKLRF